MRSLARLLAAATTSAWLGVAAQAGDAPGTFDQDWQRVRQAMANQFWAPAEASIRQLFIDHENDPDVISHLAEIEDALQTCLYRKKHRTLPPEELFGPGASLGYGCALDCKFTKFEPPQWEKSDDRFRFPLPFVDEVTVEVELPPFDFQDRNRRSTDSNSGETTSFWLCRRNAADGYLISVANNGLRIIGGGIKDGSSVSPWGPLSWFRVARRPTGAIEMEVRDGANPSSAQKYATSDRSFVGGYFWFRGTDVRSIRLKGRVEKEPYDDYVAKRLASGLAAWKQNQWSEEREIPAWARMPAPGAGAHAFAADLPPDAPKERAAEISRVVEALVRGDRATRDAVLAPNAPWQGGVAAYLRALASLAAGRADDAEARLVELDRLAPSFAPGRVFHGIARLRLRRLAEARADLEAAMASYPAEATIYEALADVALLEGDVGGAAAVLRAAVEHGAGGAAIEELIAWVQRAEAGPKRPLSLVGESEHFRVMTGVSREFAAEVAASLEAASAECAGLLGPLGTAPSPVRVWAFASRTSFDAWTGAVAPDGAATVGAYLPRLRQFSLWSTDDAAQLERTLRHEACHHLLRQQIDDPPPWLEEGLAQSFEVRAGKAGADGDADARRRRELRGRYVPLPELLAMDRAEFAAKADIAYPQSLELVSMLRATREPKLTNLLADLLAAMKGGRSKEAAAADVLAPVMPALRERFEASIR